MHEGARAIESVGRIAARVVRDAAYKKAMASMQDDFFESVGSRYGLLRESVKRRRVSREEWLRKRWLDQQREIDIECRVKKEVDVRLAELLGQHSLAERKYTGIVIRTIETPQELEKSVQIDKDVSIPVQSHADIVRPISIVHKGFMPKINSPMVDKSDEGTLWLRPRGG